MSTFFLSFHPLLLTFFYFPNSINTWACLYCHSCHLFSVLLPSLRLLWFVYRLSLKDKTNIWFGILNIWGISALWSLVSMENISSVHFKWLLHSATPPVASMNLLSFQDLQWEYLSPSFPVFPGDFLPTYSNLKCLTAAYCLAFLLGQTSYLISWTLHIFFFFDFSQLFLKIYWWITLSSFLSHMPFKPP